MNCSLIKSKSCREWFIWYKTQQTNHMQSLWFSNFFLQRSVLHKIKCFSSTQIFLTKSFARFKSLSDSAFNRKISYQWNELAKYFASWSASLESLIWICFTLKKIYLFNVSKRYNSYQLANHSSIKSLFLKQSSENFEQKSIFHSMKRLEEYSNHWGLILLILNFDLTIFQYLNDWWLMLCAQ